MHATDLIFYITLKDTVKGEAMAGIYDQQIDQVKQRAQQTNAQNTSALQRRMAAMGGGPAGAAEKLQMQSQNQVQQNTENAVAGINANQAQEEMGNQRATAAADAARGFQGAESAKARDLQNAQFGADLGFRTKQAGEQNALQRRNMDMQQQQFEAQMKRQREQDEQDNNFFSAKNLSGLARGAIGGGLALLSDENAKENIEDSDKEIGEFLEGINPVSYDYKDQADGAGKQYGIIAQDVAKHPVGKSFVIDTPKGKMVDFAKGHAVVLAAQSSLHRRLKQLEGK